MDAEDEEAPPTKSPPPLQQRSDAPPHPSTYAPQCDTDLPSAGGDLEVVTAGELSEADAVVGEVAVEADATKETVVVADEGGETQVRDVAGDEIIEKGNASASCAGGTGNEGTDVDDMALETGKVEEEASLAIGKEEEEIGDEKTNEDALMEEEGEEEEDDDDEEEHQQGVGEEEEEGTDADGGMAIAEDTEAAEETEVAEEKSASVSGGKRKRGTGKNAKSTGRVPSRKKMEEDVCFICFDRGDLVLCDRRVCPKAYHPSCVNRDEAFFRAKGKWNCGWHLCSNCERNAYYMCYTCMFSLCKGCIKDAVILCVRGNKGFCETCMRTVMLIEQNEQGNSTGQVDFDDKNSWEYLFKD